MEGEGKIRKDRRWIAEGRKHKHRRSTGPGVLDDPMISNDSNIKTMLLPSPNFPSFDIKVYRSHLLTYLLHSTQILISDSDFPHRAEHTSPTLPSVRTVSLQRNEKEVPFQL